MCRYSCTCLQRYFLNNTSYRQNVSDASPVYKYTVFKSIYLNQFSGVINILNLKEYNYVSFKNSSYFLIFHIIFFLGKKLFL